MTSDSPAAGNPDSGIPEEWVLPAAIAVHDADCPDRSCSDAALGHARRLAEAALRAAAPLIAAAERERIRELARRTMAVCTGDEGTQCYFEALLGDGNG